MEEVPWGKKMKGSSMKWSSPLSRRRLKKPCQVVLRPENLPRGILNCTRNRPEDELIVKKGTKKAVGALKNRGMGGDLESRIGTAQNSTNGLPTQNG